MFTAMVDGGTQVMNFDAAVYGLNAIRKAAYKFGDRLYVLIEQHDCVTEVRLIPREERECSREFVGEFCNEVLDQELRERVTAEIADLRSLLFARASSNLSRADCASAIRRACEPCGDSTARLHETDRDAIPQCQMRQPCSLAFHHARDTTSPLTLLPWIHASAFHE